MGDGRYERLGALLAVGLVGCSTLADSGGGDVALPNAGAGPFRELDQLELGNNRAAPNALKDDELLPRDISVVGANEGGGSLDAFGYAALTLTGEDDEVDPTAPPNGIARYRARDGRSFERQYDVVIEPELDWEAGVVGWPSALWVGDELWLYYAAAGGIGLARSTDGLVFERYDQPVLGVAAASWEDGAVPTSPTVVVDPIAGFRMFYESRRSDSEAAIGEAYSADGVHWQRRGSAPALGPRTAAPQPEYDDASVEAPHALFQPSSEGRMILWLYYSAVDRSGRRTIAAAARTSDEEPWHRGYAPVFGTSGSLGPSEPWIVRHETWALLFATQRAGSTESQDYPAVAAGVAPATAVLPPPVAD